MPRCMQLLSRGLPTPASKRRSPWLYTPQNHVTGKGVARSSALRALAERRATPSDSLVQEALAVILLDLVHVLDKHAHTSRPGLARKVPGRSAESNCTGLESASSVYRVPTAAEQSAARLRRRGRSTARARRWAPRARSSGSGAPRGPPSPPGEERRAGNAEAVHWHW